MGRTTIGKYIPGNSIIHRIDPRIKLVSNIIFIVLVFLARTFVEEGIILIPILIGFYASGINKWQPLRLLKPIIFIGIVLFLINMFIGNKSGAWVTYHSLSIGYETVRLTLIVMFRIYTMILVTTILTSTTKPTGLTKAIEDLLLPFKLIKLPVHIVAMIISIALRFIPTLIEEAQRIMKAQASRGVDFKNGGLKTKAKSMVTLIIPLFVSAFSRAEDLGNAMETRGYDPYAKRTRYRSYPITVTDICLLVAVVGLMVAIILIHTGTIPLPSWWA